MRLSTGDLQRELGLSRSVLERILRDYAREIPEPDVVAGCRTWAIEALGEFRSIIEHDQQTRR